MIENISYEEVSKIIISLKEATSSIRNIYSTKEQFPLEDFINTTEGYTKYLETTLSLYKDADIALKDYK